LALPAHGTGSPLFIALGFDPTQQANLEAALASALALAKAKQTPLTLAEIAVIDPQHQPFAKQIEPLMQKAVRNKQWLPVVYPHYTHKANLRLALGLKPSQQATYLLCNAQGQRLWQATTSQLSPQQLEALKQAL